MHQGTPPTVSPGTPMEIDATKTSQPRAPLSKEESERRRREGLCSYCGGKHSINNCPNTVTSEVRTCEESP
jgi:hypothetical protein